MITSLILDMDGVIIESVDIKTDAFRTLFSRWPGQVDEIMSYHLRNMGISRYAKIRYFYENILHEPYHEEVGERMAQEFSAIVLQKVKEAPLVPGIRRFLEERAGRYQVFVASGTPQDELSEIIYYRGMEDLFTEIYGAPETKAGIIEKILKKWNLGKKEVIFVGDAETDLEAARMTGVYFILRLTGGNGHLLADTAYSISDFLNISDLIVKIDSDN